MMQNIMYFNPKTPKTVFFTATHWRSLALNGPVSRAQVKRWQKNRSIKMLGAKQNLRDAVRKFWKSTSSRRPSAWYRPYASQNLTSDNRHILNGEECPISLRDTQALLLDALLYIVCFGIHSFIIQHPPEAKQT